MESSTAVRSTVTLPDQSGAKHPESRVRRLLRSLLSLAIVGGLAYGAFLYTQSWSKSTGAKPKGGPGAARGPRATPVAVAPAHSANLPIYLDGLGSVAAYNTVTVKSRVDGPLLRIDYKEGDFVKEGDVLAQIDPRPFEIQLAQAQGQLARDLAELNNAKAQLGRGEALYKEQIIAREQVDTLRASVSQFEGMLEADRAAIDSAKLLLSYTIIKAPISGRIGLRLVDAGNIVRANDSSGLLVITQMQPIAVLFSLSEDYLPDVLRKLHGGQKLRVLAYDREKQNVLAEGTLLTVDNQIDQATGTAKFKAIFDNNANNLFPNQFVNIRLLLETRPSQTMVPSVAVQRGPQGNFVYVIQDHKASVRMVETGPGEGDQVSIAQGLHPGEIVVIDGQDKLQEGSQVILPGDQRPGRNGAAPGGRNAEGQGRGPKPAEGAGDAPARGEGRGKGKRA